MYHPPDNSNDRPKTVRLSDRDVREAARLLSILTRDDSANDDLQEQRTAGHQPAQSHAVLLQKAKEIFLNRKRRSVHFNKSVFGEPAWDMLLALYINNDFGRRATVSRIRDLAGAPTATALRWLAYLEREGLVERAPHPTDRRSVFISLTPKGREAMDAYLSETVSTGV